MPEPTSRAREGTPAEADAADPRKSWLRFAPLALIVFAAIAFFALGGGDWLSLDAVRENYRALEEFVARNFAAALALFVLAYIAVTALSLPGATLMSVLGGFLFGAIAGTIAVVLAATIGATIIFLAARTAFGDFFRARAGAFVARMEDGFSKNAFSYLLLLRLIPLFPFFIVNVAPAFTSIRVRTYVAATFIGIIPGAFAFVSAGNGLGAILARGGELELGGLLTQPAVLIPIAALSALALLPIVLRAWRRSPATAAQEGDGAPPP